MKPRLFDYLIFVLFIGGIILSVRLISKKKETAPQVVVTAPQGEWIYSLEKAGEYSFDGNLGQTKILIKDKTVQVVDSPCDNKICIHAGKLKKNGEWAACLPNGVFLRIEGKDPDEELDVIAQ